MLPSNQLYLVLPSTQLPLDLSHLTNSLTQRFLVGYRNVLVQNKTTISWGLVKDLHYCGKAYLVQLNEFQAHDIQKIKKDGQYFEVVGQNHILLSNNLSIRKQTYPFSQEQENSLLSLIGGISKININLLKNAFDSYDDYVQMTNRNESFQSFKHKQHDLSLSQKTDLQQYAKKLSGDNLFEVPLFSKQTGNIKQDQKTKLKFFNL